MSAPSNLDRVVVINDNAIESGGAAVIALASARLLRDRHIAVTFLYGEDKLSPDLAERGIDVVSLGGRHILDGSRGTAALRGLYDPTTRAVLRRWISAHDTPGTVYHLHNWHKVLSPSIFDPLRDVASRLVISAHDYFLACPNGSYFVYPRRAECELSPGSVRCIATACDRRHYGHKLWRLARHQLRQYLFDLRTLDAVVLAVHEGTVPHLARSSIAASNIRTLRNPAMPWRVTRVPAERNRDVFFVGRLDEDKGVDLLARAARRAGVRLRVIGDGPLADLLARDYPNVTLHGWQDRDQIAALIAAARMVVSPTRCRETFGLVTPEALMSGIPVILSRFSVLSDEVVRQGFGFACDPYDEAALAAAIGELAQDDRQVERMSRRAFTNARKLAPTPAEWCDGLLALYAERLGDGRAGPPRVPVQLLHPEFDGAVAERGFDGIR